MRNLYKNLPQSPGVYLMKNARGEIIYVGKAGNLKKRVSSYFLPVRRSLGVGGRPQDGRILKLVQEITKINYKKTDTVIEALILEADLIKKYAPQYNIKDKDDKSFLYVEITKEEFPRVILTRGKNITWLSESQVNVKKEKSKTYFGPYTSASSIREALKIIRKIFPYSIHKFRNSKHGSRTSMFKHLPILRQMSNQSKNRQCFDYEIGLCPGVCAGLISRKEYLKNIKNIKLIFQGKKKKILNNLKKEMKLAAKNLEFEKAEKLRRQIFALKHIQDSSFIKEDNLIDYLKANSYKLKVNKRIEGYDISNISGTSATGSMVVFTNGKPDKNEYRKFKIKTVLKSDDVAMLREVLTRRFSRHKSDWPLPNLVLVDGGKPQVNVARKVLKDCGLKIPVVGIAKGQERKKNEFIDAMPKWADENTLIKVRDEAHRFAISFHKKLREKEFLSVLYL